MSNVTVRKTKINPIWLLLVGVSLFIVIGRPNAFIETLLQVFTQLRKTEARIRIMHLLQRTIYSLDFVETIRQRAPTVIVAAKSANSVNRVIHRQFAIECGLIHQPEVVRHLRFANLCSSRII